MARDLAWYVRNLDRWEQECSRQARMFRDAVKGRDRAKSLLLEQGRRAR